jgi:hypothetical protein
MHMEKYRYINALTALVRVLQPFHERLIIYTYIVMYRPIPKQRLCKHARNTRGQPYQKRFLCSPGRDACLGNWTLTYIVPQLIRYRVCRDFSKYIIYLSGANSSEI